MIDPLTTARLTAPFEEVAPMNKKAPRVAKAQALFSRLSQLQDMKKRETLGEDAYSKEVELALEELLNS
ncbi:hypothetical protein Y032_0692g1575 [Ancylostoma ceylanicum]|uniref:Uncharacterized protein n=1 Tax=Ancylostoma ceylanicum TaxID=53326 RepID=A0A016WHP2_9BILA|nr:hypothetical protein Y032_0692g1575 [Ancylostoma ceylanicum]